MHPPERPVLPAGAEHWRALPVAGVQEVRRAILSFPMKTAAGHGAIHPRALDDVSDQCLEAVAEYFMRCEALRAWPAQRLESIMDRLP